jgi:hypothetical protein
MSVKQSYQWDVIVPTDDTYTFEMAADNSGLLQMFTAGNAVVTFSYGSGDNPSVYRNVATETHFLYAGNYSVEMTCTNVGGPGGIAARISTSDGIQIWNTQYARKIVKITIGQNGKNHPADGGGGGGGGGGYLGGGGGAFGNGDNGGYAGGVGTSFVAIGTTGSISDNERTNNRLSNGDPYGTGGGGSNGFADTAQDGSPGVAIITPSFIARSLWHKRNNKWKSTKEVFVKDNGK